MLELVVWVAMAAIFFLTPTWIIYKRAGLNPWFSFIVFVPYLGIWLSGIVLAVSHWNLNNITKGD